MELGALIASQLMAKADRLAAAADQLQLRLERERQRTLRYMGLHTFSAGYRSGGKVSGKRTLRVKDTSLIIKDLVVLLHTNKYTSGSE